MNTLQITKYDYILENCLSENENDKETNLLSIISKLISESYNDNNTNLTAVKSFFFELSCRYLEGKISDTILLKLSMECKDKLPNFPYFFADTLWLVSGTITTFYSDKNVETELSKRLVALLSCIRKNKICSDDLLINRLENESICQLKLEDSNFIKRTIMTQKVQLFYTQHSNMHLYNENEGYSKLFAMLYNTSMTTTEFVDTIHNLIGVYSLDCNHVLDITLDALESNMQYNEYYFALMNYFHSNGIHLLLGNKIINFYKNNQAIPDSFYLLLIALAANHYIMIEDIYPYFQYTAAQVLNDANKEINEYTEAVKQFFFFSLSDKSKTVPADYSLENPYLSLFKAAATLNCLDMTMSLWTYLTQFKINPCDHPECARAVDTMLVYLIKPYYRDVVTQYSSLIATQQVAKEKIILIVNCTKPIVCQQDFFSIIVPVLFIIGPTIGYDPYLYTYVCRILNTFASKDIWKDDSFIPIFDKLYTTVLIPGLLFSKGMPSLHQSLWESMKKLPLYRRFSLYSYVYNEYCKQNPQYFYKYCLVESDSFYALHRLVQTNIQESRINIIHYSLLSPFAVFFAILKTIKTQSSDNHLILSLLDTLSLFASDVLNYVFLYALTTEEDKTNHEGTASIMWYTNYNMFVRRYLKEYPTRFDSTIFLDYIQHELNDCKVDELYLYDMLFNTLAHVYDISVKYGCKYDKSFFLPLVNGQVLNKYLLYKKIFKEVSNSNEQRFYDNLRKNNYIIQLFLSLAHIKNDIMYTNEYDSKDVYTIIKLNDLCINSLFQLSYLIKRYPETNIYFYSVISSPFSIYTEYGVEFSLLFFMLRNVFKYYQIKNVNDVISEDEKYLFFEEQPDTFTCIFNKNIDIPCDISQNKVIEEDKNDIIESPIQGNNDIEDGEIQGIHDNKENNENNDDNKENDENDENDENIENIENIENVENDENIENNDVIMNDDNESEIINKDIINDDTLMNTEEGELLQPSENDNNSNNDNDNNDNDNNNNNNNNDNNNDIDNNNNNIDNNDNDIEMNDAEMSDDNDETMQDTIEIDDDTTAIIHNNDDDDEKESETIKELVHKYTDHTIITSTLVKEDDTTPTTDYYESKDIYNNNENEGEDMNNDNNMDNISKNPEESQTLSTIHLDKSSNTKNDLSINEKQQQLQWCFLSSTFLDQLLAIKSKGSFMNISPYIYRWFWCLDYYDIHCIDESYKETLIELKKEQEQKTIDKSIYNEMKIMYTKIKEEQVLIHTNYNYFYPLLCKDIPRFFSPYSNPYNIYYDFYELCIIPRVITSIEDVVFTIEFIQLLYTHKTPYFDYIRFVSLFPRILFPLIRGCSKTEVICLSLFIRLLLVPLSEWYRNKNDEFHKIYVENIYSIDHYPQQSDTMQYNYNPITSYTQFKNFYKIFNQEISNNIYILIQSNDSYCIGNTLELIKKLSGQYEFRDKTQYNNVYTIIKALSNNDSMYPELRSSASTTLEPLKHMKSRH